MSKASARHNKLGKNNRGFSTKLEEKKQKNRDKNEQQYKNNLLKLNEVGTRELKTTSKVVASAKDGFKTVKVSKLETPSEALRRIRRQSLQQKPNS